MSLYASAVSAQRQQILSRVSSLRFDSSYNPKTTSTSPSKAAAVRSNYLFSPLQYKPVSKRAVVTDSARTNSSVHSARAAPAEAERTTTTIEGVTQKLSSTHIHRTTKPVKTPAPFPNPGEIIGKLGTRTPAKVTDRRSKENASLNSSGKHSLDVTTHREAKKRRMNLYVPGGCMLFSCSTPNTRNTIRPLTGRTTVKTLRKEQKGALGDIYDYQLDRLTMKPSERDKYSPMNHTQDDKQEEDSGEVTFFSPIKCGLVETEQSKEETTNDKHEQDDTMDEEDTLLLTPVEINFDDDHQDLYLGHKTFENDNMGESTATGNDEVFDDEEAPFAALARDYFND